jgi:hypothetical protein
MLPGIYLDPEEGARVLGTYTDVYLREEIRASAEVRDIGSYACFLDVAATMSGRWLNYSKLASDTEIPKETIRRYVSLLEDTLLVFRLPAFVPRRTAAGGDRLMNGRATLRRNAVIQRPNGAAASCAGSGRRTSHSTPHPSRARPPTL